MATIEQTSVRTNLPGAKPGTVISPPYLSNEMNAPHGAGKATQVVTITVTSAATDTEFSFVVEGETVSYTSGNPSTEADTAAGLAAAANANPLVRGLFEASVSGDDVVLTAGLSREQYDVGGLSAGLSLAEVEGSEGDRFPIAVAVYIDSDGLAQPEPSTPATQALWVSELAGVSLYHYDEEQESIGSNGAASIQQRYDITYLRAGTVAVDTAEDAVIGGVVYVETDGADAGKFFTTNSATREVVTNAKWDGPNKLLLSLV